MIATSVISLGQIIALAIPALVGFCVLLSGLLLLADKRMKSSSPAVIAGIAPGETTIRGSATGPYTITAPISGKACYCYRTTVWQQQKSQTEGWQKLADETLHVPFFVQDSTGQLLVEPLGAKLEFPVSLREEYRAAAFYGASTIPPAVNAFLSRHRITPTSQILIEESRIEPHTELFVSGTVTENPGVEVRPHSRKKANGFRHSGNKMEAPELEVVHLSSLTTSLASGTMTQQSRIAAALMKAGIQNPNAWAAAGVSFPGPAAAALQEEPDHEPTGSPEAPSGFDLKPPLVIMKTVDGGPFVLSARSIDLPSQHSRRKGLLLASIGGTLTLASFWIFLTRFLR